MSKTLVNVSRNWRYLKTWDQIHVIRRISKGGLTHLLFFLSSIISLELMPKPLVNVFSKLAMFQGLVPNPYDQEDLQGWPNVFAFPSIVNYQFGNLCPNLWSTFSRNWWCLKAWDQFHVIVRVSRGGLTHLLFFYRKISVWNFMENLRVSVFLETGDVSRPGTNSMWLGGSPRVA